MTGRGWYFMRFIAGRRVIGVALTDYTDDGTRVAVDVTLDNGRCWRFTEPASQPIMFGAADGVAYWWSARRLVWLRPDGSDEIDSLDLDEDIHLVFRTATGWLVVTEISIRLFVDTSQVAYLGLPDVLVDARWHGDRLRVLPESSTPFDVVVADAALLVEDVD